MNAERLALLDRIAQLSGGAEETEAALHARLAAEKEARIEHMRSSAMRRMLNADMAWAWSAWFDFWSTKSYALQRLREVAGRLRSPERAKAFSFWKGDWEETQKEALLRGVKQREAELEEERNELQAKLDNLAKASERRVKEMQGQFEVELFEALEQQRIELAGSAEERAAMLAEQEKEARIDLLRRQAMRRIMNADLSWSFSAWYDMWAAISRLRAIGNHFKAPGVAAAFTHWGEVALEMKRLKTLAELEQNGKALETQLRAAQFDAGQLKLTNVALEDEIFRLNNKLKSVEDETMSRAKEVKQMRNETIPQISSQSSEIAMLRRRLQEAAENISVAERKRKEAETETAEQRKKNQKLFEKLVAEQRQTFQKDTVELTNALATANEQRTALEKQLAELQADADTLQRKVDYFEGNIKQQGGPKSPGPPRPKRSGVLGNFDFVEGGDGPDLSEQILRALRASSTRILDLFREWDTDGDGKISRREFIEAMPKFGIEVDAERAGEIFDQWDADGDGDLSLREFQRSLSRSAAASKAKAQIGGAVKTTMLATRAGSANLSGRPSSGASYRSDAS